MTCSEVQRVLPELVEGAPDRAFQTDFDTHLKSCPACSELVSDLKLIASEARQLASSEEPAPRVWLRVAAQLRAEGLIRESESAPTRPLMVPVPASPRWRWSALWLAPVAVAVLAAGAYVISHKPAPQVAQQPAPVTRTSQATEIPADRAGNAVATPAGKTPVAASVPTLSSVPTPAPQQTAENPGKSRDMAGTAVATAVEPESSAEDQQFLSVVSTLGPSTRATYENQLRAVNADIRESQAYLDRNPGDADARQHLMDAYQQKALLYQIALDRIQ